MLKCSCRISGCCRTSMGISAGGCQQNHESITTAAVVGWRNSSMLTFLDPLIPVPSDSYNFRILDAVAQGHMSGRVFFVSWVTHGHARLRPHRHGILHIESAQHGMSTAIIKTISLKLPSVHRRINCLLIHEVLRCTTGMRGLPVCRIIWGKDLTKSTYSILKNNWPTYVCLLGTFSHPDFDVYDAGDLRWLNLANVPISTRAEHCAAYRWQCDVCNLICSVSSNSHRCTLPPKPRQSRQEMTILDSGSTLTRRR